MKINFVLANSEDPDEMPRSCGISSGSSLFAIVSVKGGSSPQRGTVVSAPFS